MKISREIMVKAHAITKEIKREYPEINYQFQLGICIRFLLVEGKMEMVELKGSEKQIKWAEDIRTSLISKLSNTISNFENCEKIAKGKASRIVIERLKELKNILLEKESSRFWIIIRNRDMNDYISISELTSNPELDMVELNSKEENMLNKMFRFINK